MRCKGLRAWSMEHRSWSMEHGRAERKEMTLWVILAKEPVCRGGKEQGASLNPLRGMTFKYACTSATLKPLRGIVARSASGVVVSGISPPDILIVDH